jgi:hypothetical protein
MSPESGRKPRGGGETPKHNNARHGVDDEQKASLSFQAEGTMSVKARATLTLGVLLAAGAAAYWYRGRNHELSEAPTPVHTAEIAPATMSSTLFLNLDVDQQTFSQALNALPSNCSISGKYTATTTLIGGTGGNLLTGAARTMNDMASGFKHKHKTNNPTQVSVTFEYEGNLDREPFAAVVDQGALDVSSKLSARVRGYKGDTSETVKGALTVQGKVKVDIDPDWQVRPSFDITYHWTNPPVLNLLGIRIGVENMSSSAIDKIITTAKTSLPASLNDSLKLKDKAAAFWASATEPFAIKVPGLEANGDRELWLSLAPRAVYMPTPTMKEGLLSIGFGVKADLGVVYGDKPAAQAGSALPPLTETDPTTPGIHVQLPLFVSYEGLQGDWLPKLKGQELSFPTKAGDVRIKLRDSKLYASGKGVAVGLNLSANIPGKILNTDGWVYLSGVPRVSKEDIVSLEGLQFSRIVDNELVSMVSTIGAPLIEEQLSKLLTYDLRPALSGWRQYANEHLNVPLRTLLNPLPPWMPEYLADSTIVANVSDLRVDSVVAADQGLGVTVGLDGSVRAQVKVGEQALKDALLKGLPKNAAGSGVCAINAG